MSAQRQHLSALVSLINGDVDGHPFRGNQYTKAAQEVFDKAKAAPTEHHGVDATHLTPAERRSLAEGGLHFTEDRNRKIIATYPAARRQQDFRDAVLKKRAAINAPLKHGATLKEAGLKPQDIIQSEENEGHPDDGGDGYWIHLKSGWKIDGTGSAHEDTRSQALARVKDAEFRPDAVDLKPPLKNGDLPDHEFRGNQYTKGAAAFSSKQPIDGKVLDGVMFAPWYDVPKTHEAWQHVDGQNREVEGFEQPIADVRDARTGRIKTKSAGVIVQEKDGRIWVVEPANHYMDTFHTFPKGGIDPGHSPQVTAIKEAYEESGLKVAITGYAGDYERSSSVTRYYFAKRVGGTPAGHGWESQKVKLVPPQHLWRLLNKPVDKFILADVLAHQKQLWPLKNARQCLASISALVNAAPAVYESPSAVFQEALTAHKTKVPLPTQLTTKEIGDTLGKDFFRRAFVSSQVHEAQVLDTLHGGITQILQGKNNPNELRVKIGQVLKQTNYQPPEGREGTISDLRTVARQNLIINTNLKVARGMGRAMVANDPDVLDQYPGWELVLGGVRLHHRGDPIYKPGTDGSIDWQERWKDAISECSDDDADIEAIQSVFDSTGRMIALASSSIWQALGDGAGGRSDTLGNPFPPFAWESSYTTVGVSRDECEELGLIEPEDIAEPADLGDPTYEQSPNITFDDLLTTLLDLLDGVASLNTKGLLTLS